jgi:hypothetical protein
MSYPDHGSVYTPAYVKFKSAEINRLASMRREDTARQRRYLFGAAPYVFSGLAASATGVGLQVQVATGEGQDGNGYPIYVPPTIPNSKTLLTPPQSAEGVAPQITLAAAHASLPRIDLVYLRSATLATDYASIQISTDGGITITNQVNPQTTLDYFTLGVVQGTPASTPTVPALAQSTDLAIAQVLVPASATTLVGGNVTDVRPVFSGMVTVASFNAFANSTVALMGYLGW